MPIEWAGLSPELLVQLDRTRPEPIRVQLENSLRQAIRSGRLQAGERLPSSREMAKQLSISRGVVQECYEQLYAEGYVSARAGSATRVAEIDASPSARVAVTAGPATSRPRIDFATGVPDLASFPRADWTWAQREACRSAATSAFDYGDPRGNEQARAVLAGYVRRVRGAAVDPEQIVLCAGYAQGLALTLRALAGAGVKRLAMEDPGYGRGHTLDATRRSGIEAVFVPVDEDGIDVTALAATGARAVLVTPAHQWPTGVVLAPHRRHELVAWASRADAVIIEDDYDAEFRYDREPVGVVQGLAPDHTVAIGTASKSLAPALRFGWMLCPAGLVEAISNQKVLADRGSPTLDQLTLATLIESGRYDRHLRRMRGVYAARRTALVDALATHAPRVRVSGLSAGFHAVAHLPDGVDESSVIAAARSRSVGLYGMSGNRSDRSTTPPCLVLGFGNLGERAIAEGIATVADLLVGTPSGK
jgi:GntR family transcriptional regulator/MocR family aminotransferase